MRLLRALVVCGPLCCGMAFAASLVVEPCKPNAVEFPPADARFIRFAIHAGSSSEPCIDELEVFGPDGARNLALAKHGAEASASSCLPGYTEHAIAHLNDGCYGNDCSWVAATTGEEWAQIKLPAAAKVAKVVFSRDREGRFTDRVPANFDVQLSLDGTQWTTVAKVAAKAASTAGQGGGAAAASSGTRRPAGFSASVPPPPPPPAPQSAGTGGTPVVPRTAGTGARPVVPVPRQDEFGFSNLALNPKAKAAASSLLPGHAIHQVEHLNDGLAGNSHSWISDSDPSWAEVDLGDAYWVYRVALGSDSSGQYADRAATTFSILTATEYNKDSAAPTWKAAHTQTDGAAVRTRQEFTFKPVQARWVRIAIGATNTGNARIDELEVFGQREPLPPDKIGRLPVADTAASRPQIEEVLRYALLGEEHAWLKTYGRADMSSRLVPYNGRVKEYPRHVGDDLLPLPPLTGAPTLDGSLDDPCWAEASRGVARVADPYDFARGPLVECAVQAGWKDGDLFLGIRINRLLSSHVAVVSAADGKGCGVVTWTDKGLVFNTCDGTRRTMPLDGACDKTLTCFEVRLPLEWFPDCRKQGLRVGLGMGGRHTANAGRAVNFVFSRLAIAEQLPCVGGVFRVRLAAAPGGEPVRVQGEAPGLADGLTLAPGESKIVALPARGPIGPEHTLTVEADRVSYALQLFRYDPVERTLSQMGEMLDRFAAKGLDVAQERGKLEKLRQRHAALLAAEKPDPAAEREAFFEARQAHRTLFFRDPDLEPMARLLFVKRYPFEPSHNYSDLLDANLRAGGGVYVLDIPRRDGRFEPGEAKTTALFAAGRGIARDPMAGSDASKVYFGYRPGADAYYHVWSVNADGSGAKPITDGPFNDYYPCPLPDGGLAFMSTRCHARFLCWRPQAAVLFRMDADGQNMRPLSYANLTEWAPSVMSDGRIIWTRSEYQDKGADFGHTLWSIRPDGTKPELVFGNTIIQPNGYANGHEVPGTTEFCCTLISHFGDLNGPIALVDPAQGRFNPKAIASLTPEVPWPGMWPNDECFRDPVPLARDYFLCSHAPRDRFALYVIDRFGNREILHLDPRFGSMCPTVFRPAAPPPVLTNTMVAEYSAAPAHGNNAVAPGQFFMADVYNG
ncbi:MAG: discoidin domain-containing protein, partial [Planctomycetota bacterium]|nr:discoidin domain-containing protein [Planctomycetota bacterium]